MPRHSVKLDFDKCIVIGRFSVNFDGFCLLPLVRLSYHDEIYDIPAVYYDELKRVKDEQEK